MRAHLEKFVRWVLRHRGVVLALVSLVTLASLAVLPTATLGSSLRDMFFGPDHAGFNSYVERVERFGSDEVFLFGLEVDDPLADPTLARLEAFHELAEANHEVRRVTSIVTLERVGLVGDTIGVRKFADEARDNPTRAGPLLDEIRDDPIAGGLLVASEGDDVLVLVEMVPDAGGSAESQPRKLAELKGHFEQAGFDTSRVHPGGLHSVLAEMISVSRRNLMQMFPVVTLCLLLAVWLMFGRLWPVFVTTISALVAVIWTGAFSIVREPTVNILMSILPTFVMIISFSDVVHMCSAYLLNLEAGSEKRDAIIDATVEVGAACFLTSITTATGFLALTFTPTPAFRHLGLASAVGVLIAYSLAMLLVPVLLSYFPQPKSWHGGRFGSLQGGLDRFLARLADLTTTRPWAVVALFSVFLAILVYGVLQVTIETDFGARLDDDNEVRQHAKYLEETFIEATMIEVYVGADGDGAILEEELFGELIAFEEMVEDFAEVEKAVSFVDMMRATHRSLVGEGEPFGPFGADAIAQMMVLLEMQGEDALSGVLDFERSTARMTLYATVTGVVAQHELRSRIEAAGRQIFGDDVEVEVTGIGPLMGEWLDEIVAGQRRGLLFSLIVIAILLTLGFRSLRAGLVSMIPNVIPLLTVGAWCGYFWEQTDSDTLIVGMIALGIGVDDTIHFISRYQTEAAKHDDVVAAIRETFRYSGRGICITTFVFVVGFLPAMMSDYQSIWAMGLLLPICFVVALLADLLLVPAMIRLGWIR